MANLAIKGHASRGNEVIEILEMLGGKNVVEYNGTSIRSYYFLNNNIICSSYDSVKAPGIDYYTLEEFLEKYPYKVGDKVIHDGEVLPIIGMKWDCRRDIVIYTMKNNCGIIDCYDSTWIKPYKEEISEEIKIAIPKGYEFARVDVDNQQVVFEKIGCRYPKTYEECLVMTSYDKEERILYLLEKFKQLLVCRNAYWKIAGEQMGLGKPWSPSKNDNVYCIFRLKGEIVKDNFVFGDSLILEFPTEEMRDAFYENFKGLINETKELL